MSYYNRPTSSSNKKRGNAAAALREQVKNGGSFSQSTPLSTSPIGSLSQRGRPSSAPNVNNNNMGRGLQRGALVGASNTSAISAYNFTPSNQNRQLSRRTQVSGGGGGDKDAGNRVRPSSQQLQRSSFLPSNSSLNRSGDQTNPRGLSRPYSDKTNEQNTGARNPLRSNEGNSTGRAVTAPAPRARSSGHVRQQYLAHLGIDASSAPTQSTSSSTNSTPTSEVRPGSGGLAGKGRMLRAQSEPVQMDVARNLPGTSALDASPPVMQSLSGGNNVWWKRAFTKGEVSDGGARGRGSEGKRGVQFHDQVEVRFIPLHSDYSQRVRQKYWNNAQELWEMAARNSIEYASEGYDFRNVVEEENFTRWGGQLIHPAHVQGNPSFGLNRTR